MPGVVKAHARYPEILKNLQSVSAQIRIPWRGPVYRCVEPRWAHPDHLISGLGSLEHGGRWMRPRQHPVVHGASSARIALKESWGTLRHYGIKRPRQNPRLLVQIETEFSNLADLTTLKYHLPWPSMDDLLKEDWGMINDRKFESLSQALGRALCHIGFEGLICNSSRDKRGRNIAWFPDSLGPQARVRIVGSSELKKWIVY